MPGGRKHKMMRLRSRSRSTSTEPGPQREARARRSIFKRLMEQELARPERDPPALSPPKKALKKVGSALVVQQTPGGTIRPTGAEVPIVCTSGGKTRRREASPGPLLCNDAEKNEALDMSDDEAESLLERNPEQVAAWVEDLGRAGCPGALPLSRKTSTEAHIGSTSNMPSVDAEDVRPSTSSGVTATSRPVVTQGVGSDLDSEFDDEFDPNQVNAGFGMERGIPENEVLDELEQEAINVAQSAMDEEIERLGGISTVYNWVEDFGTFRARPEEFSGPTPGPVKDYDSPYDAFTDIWSDDIIGVIVQETNRYAKQTIDSLKASGNLKPSSRMNQWVDTDADEIKVLFGIYLYMGIDPRVALEEYWVTNDDLEMPRFRSLMSINRYVLLSKFLHFIDNSDVGQDGTSSEGVALSPKLAKLVPVISHLNKKFASLYNLEQNIAIDESLTLFKGRLSWVQSIRSKSARFGIKSYELCESRTGYMYKFDIYTGKSSGAAGDAAPLSADLGGKTTKIVLDLLKGLEHRGHCLTMDNFYNCPALARYLKSLGTDCLGTLRINRKNVPVEIAKIPKNVPKGHITARHCGDVSIIAWKDSKVVPIISTYHDAEVFNTTKAGKPIVKPVCVGEYNSTMGGVDLKDQKLSTYLVERKRGLKWYVKMFKRLLNVSVLNAFIAYSASRKRRAMSTMTHRAFRKDLARTLTHTHNKRTLRLEPLEISPQITRLRKDIVHVPKSGHGRGERKRCEVCRRLGKDKRVLGSCVTCGEPLCFEDCWLEWHSNPNLKEASRSRKRTRME